MLPVSHYEALLAEVRGLRRKAQRVQELATPLISSSSVLTTPSTSHKNVECQGPHGRLNYTMDHHFVDTRRNSSSLTDYDVNSSAEGETTCSEEEYVVGRSNNSVNSEPPPLYAWTVERTMWNSEPAKSESPDLLQPTRHLDTTSVMSFACSSGGAPLDRVLGSPNLSRRSSNNQLEAKVDMVYSLLAMLGGQEHADMGETLLALSTSPESCLAMRQSGCIPLLVQLVQSDKDCDTRTKASQALQNLISAQPDEKIRKREVRIFRLLEQVREYTEALRADAEYHPEVLPSDDGDVHPVQTVAHLMKLSFDEGHRYAICQLGGINIIATLIEMEHAKHGSINNEFHCVLLRRYACMTLTNLTFGDSGNKALLCSCRDFMRALVVQLQSPSDELRQVTASVLRNLSWRADSTSKEILREVGTVTGLMKAAMINSKENTLKSILSALWNLSAHSTENKAEICAIKGALGFLVDMLTYKTPSKTLTIIENAGGILRNISSQIAVRDDYREILRNHNCLQILLEQLKSPSLTVVSNACGTLWNLSAKNAQDQEALWEMGAPAMLRSLNHSKHKMIAMGSSAALKNLLSSRPKHNLTAPLDSTARAMDLPLLPTLGARRQKAILQDLDQNLAETFENIDRDSPNFEEKKLLKQEKVWRSESQQYISHTEIMTDSRSVCSDSHLSFSEASTSRHKSFLKRNKGTPHEELSFCSKSSGYQTSTPLSSDLEGTQMTKGLSKRNLCSSLESNVQIDNEIFRTRNLDEKDHCSIEDASDSDEKLKYLSGPREEPLIVEDYSFDNALSNELNLNLDTSTVTLDDIAANLEDLDSLEMGNTQGKDLGKLLTRPKKRNKRRLEETAQAKVEQGEQISQSTAVPEIDKEASIAGRTSEKFVSYTTENKQIVTLEKPSTSTVEQVSVKEQALNVHIEAEETGTREESDVLDGKTKGQVGEAKVAQELEETGLEMGPELVETSIDNRMLDPDAMIESLDRFTAELVSQASHLQNKDEIKYTASVTEGSTWNEDTSPNDVTFPSISDSAPNVITFESDRTTDEDNVDIVDGPEKAVSNDFSSLNTSTLTDSTLIAIEATKIMNAIKIEGDNSAAQKRGPTVNLMKKALSNSYNQTSSLENLDHVNPPSAMGELLDLEGSMTSVASLASEIAEATKSEPNPIFVPKQLALLHMSSVTEIDTINPPSLLNEVTDIFDSLNDVDTEIINGDATEFEDCCTHMLDATLQMTDDYSDANNVTPLQSDFSSAESTPKRNKPINKHLTPKQRRNLARERYRTYTVAAELVTQRSQDESSETDPDFKTCSSDVNSDEGASGRNDPGQGKMTPRERRRQDRSRFETQVIDTSINDLQQLEERSNGRRPTRKNADRFKTRTLNENELHDLVQEEANLVVKTLKETKSLADDLLEYETLSLVSNDDDSENNSGSSINYRTYHKSWNLRPNVPIIHPLATDPLNCQQSNLSDDQEPEEAKAPAKPKIVKPAERAEQLAEKQEEQPKAVRGRRKPLYAAKSIPKTTKSVNSDLVRNVTSTVKSSTALKPIMRPKTAQQPSPQRSRLPAAKPTTKPASASRGSKPTSAPPPLLQRQGTFTKDEPTVQQPPKSRIPTVASKLPQSRIAKPIPSNARANGVKSASSDRATKTQSSPSRSYIRSPSVDSGNSKRSTSNAKSSGSNTSINNSTADTAANKKQITSKIASLWKKIEQTKKQQPPKQDDRVWISPSTV